MGFSRTRNNRLVLDSQCRPISAGTPSSNYTNHPPIHPILRIARRKLPRRKLLLFERHFESTFIEPQSATGGKEL